MAATNCIPPRVKGAIYGLAVCDAFGSPVEFKSRGSFDLVTTMLPNGNFGLPAGCYTDDTSMMLCLAHSLLNCDGKSNTMDQVEKYISWWRNGYMSSVGRCFDIGMSTAHALGRWEKLLERERSHDVSFTEATQQAMVQEIIPHFDKERCCGNGSLMRVLPAALIASTDSDAISLAYYSSLPTHPHTRCVQACVLYVRLVRQALEGSRKEELACNLHKMTEHMQGNPAPNLGDEELLKRINQYRSLEDWGKTSAKSIRSTGYVVDTFEAALWAFFTTNTFTEAAIRAVNLGDDADTVGAICGGLAGSHYGFDAIPTDWVLLMKKKELLHEVVEAILNHRNKSR